MIFELLVVLDGTGSVYDDIGWYLLVLPGIRWYRVSKGLVCLYILEKKWRFGRVLPMPDTQTDRQTTEYRATQLVYNIKLSHAIFECLQVPIKGQN